MAANANINNNNGLLSVTFKSSRDALLQEVSFLSARNSELEEKVGPAQQTEAIIKQLETQNGILLNLLGEKEEEVENMIADIKDVKNLYRAQMSDLYARIAPEITTQLASSDSRDSSL